MLYVCFILFAQQTPLVFVVFFSCIIHSGNLDCVSIFKKFQSLEVLEDLIPLGGRKTVQLSRACRSATNIWLVVWNIWIIFHNILGISSSQLILIFFRGVLPWWVSWNVWDLDGLKAWHWSHQDGIFPGSKMAKSKPKVVALCSNCRTFGSPKDRVLKVDVWRLLFCHFENAGAVFESNQRDPVTCS